MKRIWVTGVNGLLGNALKLEYAGQPDVRIVGLARSLLREEKDWYAGYPIDITDEDSLTVLMKDEPPQVIFHAAAMTNVDVCETNEEDCRRINDEGTRVLCDIASRVGAKVVFVSTDYVFDGEAGPYRETEVLNPVSVYGRSKAQAEEYIRNHAENWLILRTTILFGYVPKYVGKTDFVRWLVNSLQQGKRVRIVDDQYGNPTYVNDFVRIAKTLMESNQQGLFHVAGDEWISRYDFSRRIADCFGLDTSLIERIETAELGQKARRPLRGGFSNTKLYETVKERFIPLDEALAQVRKEFVAEDKA